MNRRRFIISLAILWLLALWFAFQARQQTQPARAVPASLARQVPLPSPVRTNLPPLSPAEVRENVMARHSQHAQAVTTSWLNSKNGRIDFWGLVVDQDDKPIEGVDVVMDSRVWTMGTRIGADFPVYRRKTGADGRFDLLGASGDALGVKGIGKTGYRLSLEDQQGAFGFTYHGSQQDFIPDPANPVVFKLWKIRGAECLAYQEHLTLQVDVNRTPLQVDLLAGRPVAAAGHLEFRLQRNPENIVRNQRNGFAWEVEISSPDGGVLWRTDHFGFEAPDSGYQPKLIISQAKDDPEWLDEVAGELYIKTAQGYYGRVRFRLHLHSQPPPCFLSLETYLNPSGSRNLEYEGRMNYAHANISSNGVFQPPTEGQFRPFLPVAPPTQPLP